MKPLTQVLICALLSSLGVRVLIKRNWPLIFAVHLLVYFLCIFLVSVHQAARTRMASRDEMALYERLVDSFRPKGGAQGE